MRPVIELDLHIRIQLLHHIEHGIIVGRTCRIHSNRHRSFDIVVRTLIRHGRKIQCGTARFAGRVCGIDITAVIVFIVTGVVLVAGAVLFCTLGDSLGFSILIRHIGVTVVVGGKRLTGAGHHFRPLGINVRSVVFRHAAACQG